MVPSRRLLGYSAGTRSDPCGSSHSQVRHYYYSPLTAYLRHISIVSLAYLRCTNIAPADQPRKTQQDCMLKAALRPCSERRCSVMPGGPHVRHAPHACACVQRLHALAA